MKLNKNFHPNSYLQNQTDRTPYEKMRTMLIMMTILIQSEQDIKKGAIVNHHDALATIEKKFVKNKSA